MFVSRNHRSEMNWRECFKRACFLNSRVCMAFSEPGYASMHAVFCVCGCCVLCWCIQACWTIHYFSTMEFESQELLKLLVDAVRVCLTQDSELPVKVEAAVALQSLLDNQETGKECTALSDSKENASHISQGLVFACSVLHRSWSSRTICYLFRLARISDSLVNDCWGWKCFFLFCLSLRACLSTSRLLSSLLLPLNDCCCF